MKIGLFISDDPILPEPILTRATDFLRENGINYVIHPSTLQAVTARDKAAIIHDYLNDESVDVLMAFWGGTKTIEMLKYLDFDLINIQNKPIIGYSDTTSLLQAVASKTSAPVYHGAALISFAKQLFREDSLNSMLNALNPGPYIAPNPRQTNIEPHSGKPPIITTDSEPMIFKEGKSYGISAAGNLQTLLLLNGTEFELKLTDKILFIEEDESINESLFRRYLTQLMAMREFSKLKGLVISKFTNESSISKEQLINILSEYNLDSFNFPIVTNINSGHCDPIVTIPINRRCNLDAQNNSVRIIFE